MRRSLDGRQRRVLDLTRRIASSCEDHLQSCTIPDRSTGRACGRLTARADKAGLSAFTCRYHQQHHQRHGSHWCKSPSAITLKPYLSAAMSFIRSNGTGPFVRSALTALDGIMAATGPLVVATRLVGLRPELRAKIALARLREANVKPERLLAIAVAVSALIEDAPEVTHRTREWRIVAIAKATHRLASGYHRVWEVRDENGNVAQRTEMHVYPRSSGRVLRYLGEMIERECELVIDHHLAGVLALKIARDSRAAAAPGTS